VPSAVAAGAKWSAGARWDPAGQQRRGRPAVRCADVPLSAFESPRTRFVLQRRTGGCSGRGRRNEAATSATCIRIRIRLAKIKRDGNKNGKKVNAIYINDQILELGQLLTTSTCRPKIS